MPTAENQRFGVTLSLLLFLCLATLSFSSCSSSSKSQKDEEVAVGGTTLSLDELDYTKGLNKPLPDEEPPPPDGAPSKSQPVAPTETGSLPLSPSLPVQVRHPKKRVFVLPFENYTLYKDQPYGEIVAEKLVQALEGSDGVVVLDDRLLSRFVSEKGIARDDLTEPFWIKGLHSAFGVHAVVSGSLTQLNVAATKSSVSQDVEVGLAIARLEARLVDASTGNTIRTYVGRNPLYKSKEIGEFSRERAVLRAMDIGVEEIARGVGASLRFFEWSARVVRVESGRIYIDAGQQSGLRSGDILDLYGPGEEIINAATQRSLGWAPGDLKGRIEVSGFFGVDGAYGTPLEGADFRTGDVVKVSRSQEE